jgi:protoheme IX farnesyltransferase
LLRGKERVRRSWRDGYFSANSFADRRGNITSTASASEGSSIAEYEALQEKVKGERALPTTKDLPHRQRKARKDAEKGIDLVLPPNTSSQLTTTAEAAPTNSLRRLLPVLLSLSKPRLSILVMLTSAASYALYPVPELLSSSLTQAPSLSPLTFLFLTSGTLICAASANTFNMLYEPKWDAMMSRTRNRPLVRKLISTRGALIFAVLAGLTGTGLLYVGVNPTVSFLGATNILLYAAVYTPLKRVTVINTWVGALVGGIPPLMGWAAGAGEVAREGGPAELLLGMQNVGGWLLAGLLVAWQFPHFMSLSWSIRNEYKEAGYKMLCWVNPAKNGRVALRYSILMIPICLGLTYVGVTGPTFAAGSLPINVWMIREAFRFWKCEGTKGSARGLFWASVCHLPFVMLLAVFEKGGIWTWKWIFGQPDLEDGWEWEDEEEAVLSAKYLSPEARRAAISMPVAK